MVATIEKPVVVVGAGPSGLMQALYLGLRRKRRAIVIEQAPGPGGMFASIETPWGMVDQGVHILQETGTPVWDDLFFEILPRDEWQIFAGVRKDIGGNVFEGKLHAGAMFPDLRSLPREEYVRCVGEMFAGVAPTVPTLGEAPNLARYFEARFGAYAVQRVFEPLARKLWQRPLDQLSPWAAKIVHLSRVVTHPAAQALALKTSPVLDAVVGFPDQLAFPAELLSNHDRTLYPNTYGLRRVVTGLCNALERAGGEVLSSTQIDGFEILNGRVQALHLTGAAGEAPRRLEVDAVLWTSPHFGLLRHLGLTVAELPDPGVPHRMLHLFLDKAPRSGELYWFWSYDPADPVVRVSNPSAYCANAAAAGVYPLCVEMHVADPAVADDVAAAEAEKALRTWGVIGSDTAVVGSAVLRAGRSFMLPTVANLDTIASARAAIAGAGIGNLFLSTQDLASGVFYLPEILNASTEQLDTL